MTIMDSSKKSLSNIFNIPDSQPTIQLNPIESCEKTRDTQSDNEITRQRLLETMDYLDSAIQEMREIARSSQHPRSYEALNSLLKTMIEASQQLIDTQIKTVRLNQIQGDDSENQDDSIEITINQLQRLLLDKK